MREAVASFMGKVMTGIASAVTSGGRAGGRPRAPTAPAKWRPPVGTTLPQTGRGLATQL